MEALERLGRRAADAAALVDLKRRAIATRVALEELDAGSDPEGVVGSRLREALDLDVEVLSLTVRLLLLLLLFFYFFFFMNNYNNSRVLGLFFCESG